MNKKQILTILGIAALVSVPLTLFSAERTTRVRPGVATDQTFVPARFVVEYNHTDPNAPVASLQMEELVKWPTGSGMPGRREETKWSIAQVESWPDSIVVGGQTVTNRIKPRVLWIAAREEAHADTWGLILTALENPNNAWMVQPPEPEP